MFGVPIKPSILATLALLVLPLCAQAQVGVAIRKADQLAKTDAQLRAYEEPYILASSGSLIYDICGADLAITEPERVYFKKRYAALSNAYLQSFEDSFVARWKIPSDAALSRDYARYMNDLRAPAIEQTRKSITTLGCTNKRVKVVVDYFRKIQAAEAKGNKIPLAPIVKKR
jgi:hypothetical protein